MLCDLMLQQAIAHLLQAVTYLPEPERAEVRRAADKAVEWHGEQARASGEPYVTHPIAVATYLAELEASKDVLIAALLHDVLEDRDVTYAMISAEFGERVASLVDGVTKLSKLEYPTQGMQRQIASLRKLLQVATADLRVLFIKLADRWHNVQSLGALRGDKSERIARETLDVYVPFARMVGLWELKSVLENACFPIAYPKESADWSRAVAAVRAQLEPEREQLCSRLDLETTDIVEARIDRMSDYDLFIKLQGNAERLQNTSLIDTVLMVVKNPQTFTIDCYRVLGEIHMRYRAVPISFRDYISTPQPNGYRALHTVIFISHNHQIRLRIQTQRMHEYSAKRKLSYWLREGSDILEALQSLQHNGSDDNGRYAEDLRGSVLSERITVFTAAGELLALPRGATGVDFAVAQNPDNVHYLEGVIINGQRYDAGQELRDGDIVELVLSTEKVGARSRWLMRVKSPESRRALEQTLQSQDAGLVAAQGRQLLEAELRKHRTSIFWLRLLPYIPGALKTCFDKTDMAEVYLAIGNGSISPYAAVDCIVDTLAERTIWIGGIARFLGLLPRSRVVDAKAQVMDIRVYGHDRTGLIYDITRCFAMRNVNIAGFGVHALPAGGALYSIHFEVPSFDVFSDLYDDILNVEGVREIVRQR
jgi:guanosine-3',5'-bis(diphosphate) 3'-pyrophosphohydrolase